MFARESALWPRYWEIACVLFPLLRAQKLHFRTITEEGIDVRQETVISCQLALNYYIEFSGNKQT